jgi:hypothetical protein
LFLTVPSHRAGFGFSFKNRLKAESNINDPYQCVREFRFSIAINKFNRGVEGPGVSREGKICQRIPEIRKAFLLKYYTGSGKSREN